MKKLFNWLGEWLPIVWGLAWVAIITLVSIGMVMCLIKWVCKLLGVM